MRPKRRRLYLLIASLATLGVAAALILGALEDNIVFFYAPSDLAAKDVRPGQRLRLGGLVAEGSVQHHQGEARISFEITDLAETVPVSYTGILPDLFGEGQGVIAEGVMGSDGTFQAEEVLAKHDETYMPPEVADALKRAGQWKGDSAE